MPEERVAWGIVGLGRHAERYVAPGLRESGGARLHAVCSNSRARAEGFAAAFGGCAAYDSLDAMLADDDLECVFVCSGNTSHEEQVRRIAESGRHVLCEKPLALSEEACLSLIEVCESKDVVLGVGFHLRSNPAVQEARRQLTCQAVGTIVHADIQYIHIVDESAPRSATTPSWRNELNLGGAEFGGAGLHVIDLTRFLLDAEYEALCATTFAELGSNAARQVVQTSAVMTNGAVVSMRSGKLPHAENTAVIHGTKGVLRLEHAIGNVAGGTIELRRRGCETTLRFPPGNPYQREVDDFVIAVRSGCAPLAGGVDAVRALRVVDAIKTAVSTRREVPVAQL